MRSSATVRTIPHNLQPPLSGLSDLELLNVILGPRAQLSPIALTSGWPDGLLALVHLSVSELAHGLGVTTAAARKLAVALELHRRLLAAACPVRPIISTPEEAAAVLAPFAAYPEEHFWCLPLDVHSRLIGAPVEISRGDVDGCDAGPRAVLRAALRVGAVGVIVAHNHPSGQLVASAADLAVTRRLVAAGRAVDIRVQDHVIVGPDRRFVSLRCDVPECFR